MSKLAGLLERASGLARRRATCRLLGHAPLERTIIVREGRASQVCERCGEPVGHEVPYEGGFVSLGGADGTSPSGRPGS